MIDPIYKTDCIICEESSDETIFYRLINRPSLSYSIHKDLLKNKNYYKIIKKVNNEYHLDNSNKDFLSFCKSKTIFTNLSKKYVFLDNLRKGKK